MSKILKVGFPAFLFSLLQPLAASGQSITTGAAPITNGPGPIASVPIDNPLALALLAAALAITGWWFVRRGYQLRHVVSLLLLAVLTTAGVHGSHLVAQVLTSFTNPAGETRAITISPITAGGFTGFEPADFTNNAGQGLKILGVVEPDFAQCFTANPADTLQAPGAPPPSPPPTCSVGLVLANGATCRVDVEAICRSLIPPAALTGVNPASGTAAGGVGMALTGTGLAGATAVSFGGVAATAVHVVNSTTLTAVAPAHAAGSVDVVITIPGGTVTLTNGFTYLPTAIGQPSGGGTIAALNGGLNNLIAATADNSTGLPWGGMGITTNATSNTDGASNSSMVGVVLGSGTYAAQVCNNYAVDSQGNTPCQPGNTCYNDWFVPSGNNPNASGQLNALYVNRMAIGGFSAANYWSSTESGGNAAHGQDFTSGAQSVSSKALSLHLRCVRSFLP